jgi:osmotically-inducible protein OsmY
MAFGRPRRARDGNDVIHPSLTVAGTLDWQYQKDAASRAVRELTGVKGVTNDIRVKPTIKTADVRDKIGLQTERRD